MSELSVHELETQHGELLPERETLGIFQIDVARITQAAANVAIASVAVQQNNQAAAIIQG